MAYHLCIDRGNSCSKISVHDAATGECRHVQVIRKITAGDIAEIATRYPVTAAIYSSVAVKDETLLGWLKDNCEHVLILTPRTPRPFGTTFPMPDTMGVDRIAAAAGALTLPECRGKRVLLVDLGTAITYDHLTENGLYAGGNISAGIYLRLKALHQNTALLPQVEPSADCPFWGHDTRTAMLAGALNGVVAEMEWYRKHIGPDTLLLVTGGGAELVTGHIENQYIYEPNLVCRGLWSILKYNLNA